MVFGESWSSDIFFVCFDLVAVSKGTEIFSDETMTTKQTRSKGGIGSCFMREHFNIVSRSCLSVFLESQTGVVLPTSPCEGSAGNSSEGM